MSKTVGDFFWERLSHIALKQTKAFASTLWQGDSSEFKIIKESAKEIIEDFLPQKS